MEKYEIQVFKCFHIYEKNSLKILPPLNSTALINQTKA